MNNNTFKTVYKCPVCGEELVRLEKQYVCERKHSFDISERNHVNLLLANQKKTKDPGDNKEMMENRRNFLNKGYYSKFSEGLNEAIAFHLDPKGEHILDAGCGEGYFICMLKDKMNTYNNRRNMNYYGMDISKSAIKYATRRDKTINFSIGSSFNLPFLDNSLDCVIRNFAPGEANEFRRVLKDTGKFIVVTPAVYHLFELKERLYEKPRKHEEKDALIEGFQLIDHREIKYDIHLNNNEDIQNLITMTPYYWSITKEMRSKLEKLESFKVTLNFNIHVYKKS